MVSCKAFPRSIKVTPLLKENPLPFFREYPEHRRVLVKGDRQTGLQGGLHIGTRVLPYRMQDHFSPTYEATEVLHVKLENEYLAATFLPHWGGRLISLFDKEHERELLYSPSSITLGNLALRGAWFVGGIEWNLGYYGHTVDTVSPVFCARIDVDGEPGLRLANYDRMQGLWWQIDFSFSDSPVCLLANITVINDNRSARDLYWWTNVAVTDNNEQRRVFVPAARGIFRGSFDEKYEIVDLPKVNFDNKYNFNLTYNSAYPMTSECFFPLEKEFPWVGVFDAQGQGLVEISTSDLRYRKIFCWGQHAGGQNWQRVLNREQRSDYFEIQAGLAPSQQHTDLIPAKSLRSWSEIFAPMSIDPALQAGDFHQSREPIGAELRRRYDLTLGKTAELATEWRDKAPTEIYTYGTPWAVFPLMEERQASCLPTWLFDHFLAADAGDPEVKRWHDFLSGAGWKPYTSIDQEMEWVTGENFQYAVERELAAGNNDWSLLLHLGVLYRDKFSFIAAQEMFLASLRQQENYYAYWGLIELNGNIFANQEQTLFYCRRCLELAVPIQLRQQIVAFLIRFGVWDEARAVVQGCSAAETRSFLSREAIEVALHFEDFDQAKELLLRFDHKIREGKEDNFRYWEILQQKMLAQGLIDTAEPLPVELDFSKQAVEEG